MSEIIHTFSRPFEFEGKKYEFLTFDFDKLSGKDLREIRRAFDNPARPIPVLAMDEEFLMLAAAKAAQVPYELIDALPMAEAISITTLASQYFFQQAYSAEQAKEINEAKKKLSMG